MSGAVVVIGGGVNELVAAHTLARAGRKVLVIQEDDTLSLETGWIPPRIVGELALQGLKIEQPDPWAVAPLADGGRLELWRDMARSVESIRGLSPRDAARWPEFCERVARLAGFLERLYGAVPPDPLSARFALQARLLGRQGLTDLLRLLPMPVAELLDDWFESDALKGLLGAAGVARLLQGPRSGGTAFGLLHRHVGSPLGVFRPPRSNIKQVLVKLQGIEIRQDAEVARITVRAGRVAGVVLAKGEEIATCLVVSGAGPRRTLLELIDPGWLDPELARAVRHIRCRGVVARVTLQLDRAPGFSTLVIAPSLDYLERAYDDAKYGDVSREPWLEARCDERHCVDVLVQYVPSGRSADLGDRVVKMLSRHLQGASVIERNEALSPEEQAELALDQALWMRPVPSLARYRTPIEGLWLCGSAMHPGGDIAGAAGYNCARQIKEKSSA
jgi:phytoene dehydrogenase-like protein